jgi:selenide,water dikinase
VLDDPYDFGRVVAANSLSDAYAMGARPLTALAIAIVPGGPDWVALLATMMKGMADVCLEDRVALLGGHTMLGQEPVLGLSVTGIVHPSKVTSNASAKPGDVLVLTKPLGSGILTTALKKKLLSAELLGPLTRTMCTTNRLAADAAARNGAHSATDVTGFGLLGHLHWMMRESGTVGVVRSADVPWFPGTIELQDGNVPGGSFRNLQHVLPTLAWEDHVDEATRVRLADAQTSGGLIVALPPENVEGFLADLPEDQRAAAAVVGEVAPGEDGVFIRIV